MSKPDYYTTLGVSKDASEAEIKKAYRRLAMKYHPDRNSDDADSEQKFKAAKEAYEVLTNAQKRSAYDQFGHAGVDPSAGGGFGGAGGFSGEGLGDIFGSMFGDIFGGARGRSGSERVQRGADLRYELDISLEQAGSGDEVTIRIPSLASCDTCSGSGAKAGSKPKSCDTCGGQGQVRMQQGFFSVQQPCPNCHGRGQVIDDPCGTCHGNGRTQKTKTLKVDIPAGVDTGNRIRLGGEGEAGPQGGPSGDLYVEINILPHQYFERDGRDLHCMLPISFATAALGGTVEVPTLTGRVSVKIPAGTQTNKVFRVRGKGMRTIRSSMPGDLHCHAKIETPINLSKEQKELIQQLQDSLEKDSGRHNPEVSSWLDGVKGFFERFKKAG